MVVVGLISDKTITALNVSDFHTPERIERWMDGPACGRVVECIMHARMLSIFPLGFGPFTVGSHVRSKCRMAPPLQHTRRHKSKALFKSVKSNI